MAEINIDEKSLKLYCEKCNFQSKGPAQWLIHIESAKHKRDGKKKTKTCTICNITYSNHFTYKIHNLSTHATKEERSKHKYYCQQCDYVFISELFYLQHCKGIIHRNRIKVLESLNTNPDISK
jgi:Zn finger protein HypA/HybF involved in hydrogenase expression